MLHDFIVERRNEITERTRQRARRRSTPKLTDGELEHGVPTLLTQIIEALAKVDTLHVVGGSQSSKEICDAAALNGRESLGRGLTVTQVVNGYGDVCQVVTELAGAENVSISAQDFQIFNGCLDQAVAGAVESYTRQRERELAYEGSERVGILAHEMRNLLHTMTLSFAIIRAGKVGLGGSTGAMLARSMSALCTLVDRSLTEVRLEVSTNFAPISMVEFIEEMQISGAVHAEAYGMQLTVHPVARDLMIDGDRQLLASAVSNLLQNAFKFSRAHGHVALATSVDNDRVLIEIRDECGGLPAGKAEELFRPFAKASADHSGLGLGLSIARRAAQANGGDIRVRDIPGTGCVFTVELPRRPEVVAQLAV